MQRLYNNNNNNHKTKTKLVTCYVRPVQKQIPYPIHPITWVGL
jgi:hypothetical protein